MKISLKNFFEIKCGNETFFAENTILPAAFSAISEFSPYTKFLAFGTGKDDEGVLSTGVMQNCVAVFPTQTDSVQLDPSKGDLFVRKKVVISSSEFDDVEFFEVGFTFSNSIQNPLLANHAIIKSKSGTIAPVSKKKAEDLVVTATVFMSIESQSDALPVLGDNKFLKAIMGEEVFETFPTFKIAKGKLLTPNILTTRNSTISSTIDATPVITSGDNFVTFSCSANLGVGETFETVVLANDEPVFRLNTGWLQTQQIQKTVTGDVDRSADTATSMVKRIVSATDTSTGLDVDVNLRKYAKRFGDVNYDYPFALPYTKDTTRFVSKEGNRIAFVTEGRVDIYENSQNSLKKLDSDVLTMGSIVKVLMFLEHVFVFQSVSPFVQHFKYIDGVLTQREFSLNSFMQSVEWSTISDFDCGYTNEGTILMAVITPVSTQNGYALVFSEGEDGTLSLQTTTASPNNNIIYVAGFIPQQAMNGFVLFTTNDNNETGYDAAYFYVDSAWSQISQSLILGTLNDYTIKKKICKSGIYFSRTNNPYRCIVFFPQYRRYVVATNSTSEFFLAASMKYIGRIVTATKTVSISSLSRQMIMTATTETFPTVPFEIEDMEILDDLVLVFSSSGSNIVAIPLFELESFVTDINQNQTVDLVLEVGVPPGSTAGSTVEASFSFIVN